MTCPCSMRRHALRAIVLAAAATMILSACGGGSSGSPGADSRYAATLLVSDQAGAAHLDAQLSNPWDFAVNGATVLWLTNPGSGHSRLFNASDLALPALVVDVPAQSAASARPTGVAFNAGNGFEVTSAGRSGVARFIVASEGGTLSGWAPSVDIAQAVIAFDGSATGAVYTGLAMTPQGVDSVLLAADFHNGVVDTFGPDFVKRPAGGRFIDPVLPAGYAPFGIAAVSGGLVYLTYAKPDATAHALQAGAGLGLVNVFDGTGQLVRRVVPTGGTLNAPWSVAIAPAGFGMFGGALLVANSGDGTIAAFDAASGRSLGTLRKPDGSVLVIDGLHRIAFGNGALGQALDALFFTAGPQGGRHGHFGRIDLQ
jgi:uncharacterized protein (TIGR03118 family)